MITAVPPAARRGADRAGGNPVNVTSLLYLVPIATAGMDHWILGNALSPLNLGGMAAILAGLVLVFRGTTRAAGRPEHAPDQPCSGAGAAPS